MTKVSHYVFALTMTALAVVVGVFAYFYIVNMFDFMVALTELYVFFTSVLVVGSTHV